MAESLDAGLKQRIKAVLSRPVVTEVELRKLTEEGRVSALILGTRLEEAERFLSERSSDPDNSLAEIAAALRDVNDLWSRLEELEQTLEALDRRARELRTAWLSAS